MRIRGKKLEWYVLNWSTNERTLKHYNIFYEDYNERLYKAYKKGEIKTLADLKEFTRRYCFNYMGRVEYEILVNELTNRSENSVKIDVYEQVMMNIDRIVEYVNNELKMNLK